MLALEAKPPALDAACQAGPRRRGEPTLDERILSAWEGLTAHRPVACVVCGSPMTPHFRHGIEAARGRCDHCDCWLS